MRAELVFAVLCLGACSRRESSGEPLAATATPAIGAASPSASPVAAPSAHTSAQPKTPPTSEAACKSQCNGEWGRHGLAPNDSCLCRTSDGGKRCRDGAECEGECTLADPPATEVVEKGPPARGHFVGTCSAFTTVFGCLRRLGRGQLAQGPVDLSDPPGKLCAD